MQSSKGEAKMEPRKETVITLSLDDHVEPGTWFVDEEG
jgi:hypothetical protein